MTYHVQVPGWEEPGVSPKPGLSSSMEERTEVLFTLTLLFISFPSLIGGFWTFLLASLGLA